MVGVLNRLRREESGAVMVIAALSLTTLLLFAGLALDFGRAHLLRAELQTAVDAAALAGALQVVEMVSLESDRWREVEQECYDPTSGKPYICYDLVEASPARASGTKSDLVRSGGWRREMRPACQGRYICSDNYRVVREWLLLPDSTAGVARQTFLRNAVWPGGSGGAEVQGIEIQVDQSRTEVTATATLRAPTTFLKLAGISYLQIHRTGTAIPVRR